MADVIVKDNKTYGFQADLGKYIKECMDAYAQDKNWEEVKEMADLLLDLADWEDNENMLVVNDNNGMGYTIYEYKKGE